MNPSVDVVPFCVIKDVCYKNNYRHNMWCKTEQEEQENSDFLICAVLFLKEK
jgi:hypothetical protein